jgi:DNA modification methylase
VQGRDGAGIPEGTWNEEMGVQRHRSAKVCGNQTGRKNKRDVWTIPVASFSEAHFAVFPEEIPELAIKAGSKKDDIILDPFAGSGTTGIVSIRLGRKFIGLDINQDYCKMANERLESTKRGQTLQQFRSGQGVLPGLPFVGED